MSPRTSAKKEESRSQKTNPESRSPSTSAVGQRRRKRSAADSGSQDDLMRMSLKACLIARDSAFNIRDLLTSSSRMAFLAVRDCEKELDQIERQIDERLPGAITRVNEARARQLLACLKGITDLERIGDLFMSVAQRVHSRTSPIPGDDVRHLVQMSVILHDMLDEIYRGFRSLDLETARRVLRVDSELDRICHSMFQKHLAERSRENDALNFEVLLMAQALERAGDHAKNLAEELYALIEGHTLRHPPKRTAAQ